MLAAVLATLILFAAQWAAAIIEPDSFRPLIARGEARGRPGLAERLTPLVLLAAILVTTGWLVFGRSRWPSRGLRFWVAAWTVAAFYFMGEEMSWGQWYFGWQTPEFWQALNRQGETNLHNVSPWFDHVPRTLVEIFIVSAGLVLPVARATRSGPFPRSDLRFWLYAPVMCWPAAAAYGVSRLAAEIESPRAIAMVGSGELQEFWIAWFVALYLISFPLRLSVGSRPVRARGQMSRT